MKLTIFNGSPRGENSNSSKIIKWLLDGYSNDGTNDNDVKICILKKINEHKEYADEMSQSDMVLLIFPLYTDSMPGLVKAFIENLEDYKEKLTDTKICYIVHSGFPEACHSRYIEKYLERLTTLLGAKYLGTVVMGDSEGIRMQPEFVLRNKKLLFGKIGRSLKEKQAVDGKAVQKLASIERIPAVALVFFRLFSLVGLVNSYWNKMLKENNAFSNRFDKPYA